MILGQISYLDCIVYLIFLAPQLLLQINVVELFLCILKALPFLCLQLPYDFTVERYYTRKNRRSPFVQRASPFQDIVIRCVRYAFAQIPAKIGRVFFSKAVALPFLRFRMIRHGFWRSPIHWREIKIGDTFGIWIIPDSQWKPDVVVYYCHGGGFSMGSGYFYLEFLMAWVSLLKDAGYHNPAIFAMEYSLVPDAVYPTQLQQTVAGYMHVCSIAGEASRVCVGGDSAGATLILCLLLHLAQTPNREKFRPGYATLISPWPTLVSSKNQDTASDYLNANSLHLYGRQYATSEANLNDPLVSPGVCKNTSWWAQASPLAGFGILFGSEEVFSSEIKDLVTLLRNSGSDVCVREEPGSVHAWPVVTLFLSDTQAERQKGLKELTSMMKQSLPPKHLQRAPRAVVDCKSHDGLHPRNMLLP